VKFQELYVLQMKLLLMGQTKIRIKKIFCWGALVEKHWYRWRRGVWVLHLSSAASLLASRTLRKTKEILVFWLSVFWV